MLHRLLTHLKVLFCDFLCFNSTLCSESLIGRLAIYCSPPEFYLLILHRLFSSYGDVFWMRVAMVCPDLLSGDPSQATAPEKALEMHFLMPSADLT